MKQIEECYQILKDPNGYVKRFKAESRRKVVGTFCSYAPEEIILAAGAHPFRLFGSGEKIRLADAHLQAYCCSLVRGALEDALGGRLEFLDGVVFPHTCDSIQHLSDIWRLNVPTCFHLDVVLPVKLDTDGARQYLIDVLNRFRGELGEKLGVTISDDDLRTAIRTCNRIRAALGRIYDLKSDRPEILKGSDLYALVRAAMVMDRGRLADLLEEVAVELALRGGEAASPPKKRIVLSGGVCNHPDIYTIVEEAGGAVVGDDLCTGFRFFKAPLFILDTPFCHTAFSAEAKRYVKGQITEYIAFLENICKKKFDYDRIMEVGKLSLEGQRLWQEVLDTAMNRPAPLSAFDAFFHLALIVTLRGTQQTVDYYRMLLAEMQERVAQGIGAVPSEKYRLLWDNIPVWFRTRWLSEKFAAQDACLVAATYTSAWCGSMKYIKENDFLETMAEGYSRIYLNIGVDEMAREVMAMADKYEVDGIVMHSNRSCKPYSFGQYDIQRIIREKKRIPTVMIEADMVDERSFSESQIETRIDAFIEVMKEGKRLLGSVH